MKKLDRPDTKAIGWKNTYRNMGYKGYEWGGWLEDEGLHFFFKKDKHGGGFEIKCKDSELFDSSVIDGRTSFQMLVDNGMTR